MPSLGDLHHPICKPASQNLYSSGESLKDDNDLSTIHLECKSEISDGKEKFFKTIGDPLDVKMLLCITASIITHPLAKLAIRH